MIRGLAVVAALALLIPTAPPGAAEYVLQRARTLLGEAEVALREVDDGQSRLSALGSAVAAQEAALAAYRTGIRQMARRERELTEALLKDEARLGEVLGAMQMLARSPTSASFAFPGGPVQAARAASMMAEIAPALEAEREALLVRLDRLQSLRISQEVARLEGTETLDRLQHLRTRTAAALSQRRLLLPEREEYVRLAEAASLRARDLDGFAETLGAVGPARRAGAFALSAGDLQWPVAGDVVARFGEPDPWGRAGHGWSIAGAPFSQVTAPFDASVRYAGPLPGYGDVLVLEPDAGWLILFAGLGRIHRQVGEVALQGEPLADLGGDLPNREEFLLEAAGQEGQISEQVIYLELRRDGEPVDPATWFRTQRK